MERFLVEGRVQSMNWEEAAELPPGTRIKTSLAITRCRLRRAMEMGLFFFF